MRVGDRWSPLLGVLDRDRARLARRLSWHADDTARLVAALRAEFVDVPASALHRRLQGRAARLAAALEDGEPLDAAFSAHPGDFDAWEIALGRVAESVRDPRLVLAAWAARLERRADAKDAVSNVLVYPALLLLAFSLAWLVLLSQVLPTFAALYNGLGSALPLSTRLLIHASNVAWDAAPFAAGLAAALALAAGGSALTARGRRLLARLGSRIPVLGSAARRADRALAFEMLAALIESGVEAGRALSLSAAALPSRASRESLAAEAARRDAVAPERGEAATGGLDAPSRRVLDRCFSAPDPARLLRRRAASEAAAVERAIAGSLAMLEPLVILGSGLLLAFAAVAMLSPAFDLVARVGG